MRKIVVSLCDYTGNFVESWIKNGYEALLVDIQHPPGITFEGRIIKFGYDLQLGPHEVIDVLRGSEVAFVAAFPPCTDLAVSGAKWFATKAAADPDFQKKAMNLVYVCRDIAEYFDVPYFIENPVGKISTFWRKPDYIFHPYYYTHYCKTDNYKKKTCLWTNNKFVMPGKYRDTSLPSPDDRIHKCPPSKNRGMIRSVTPLGFSRAVYKYNKPNAITQQLP
jgi:hypothetical protein